MKVLGINFSNDAAAALVVDGEVVAAVAEERLSRIKHDAAFPARAIRYCLDHAALTLGEVDAVGFFWNPGIHAEPANHRLTAVPRDHLEFLYALPVQLMRHFDGLSVTRVDQTLHLDDGRALRLHFLTHHDCHAAAAFFRSNYERAAILTLDGYGERTATQIAHGNDRRIEVLSRIEFPHSIGSFYAAFTQYLGYRPNGGEGKVMGLASYGDAQAFYEPIRKLVRLTDNGFELDLSYFSYYLPRRRRYTSKLVELLGPERQPESDLDQRHMDIAAGMQLVTEELILKVAGMARELTGESQLCVAGGVALNCVANTRVAREAGFERCYFMPAASDAGSSLGAALWVAHLLGDDARREQPQVDALGPGYSDDDIEHALRVAGCRYQRPSDLPGAVAELLAAGEIVGLFQGRAEFGPRALGNRSILADPRSAEMKDVLNSRVKFREWFRPFAPAVLAERCAEFFTHPEEAPYMLLVYPTSPAHADELRAVTHVDGGARVQTVRREQNPVYYDVIRAFGELTGIPVVLNTSFNIRGEPIVTTPAEALRCYFTTGLDAVALGPFLLRKRG